MGGLLSLPLRKRSLKGSLLLALSQGGLSKGCSPLPKKPPPRDALPWGSLKGLPLPPKLPFAVVALVALLGGVLALPASRWAGLLVLVSNGLAPSVEAPSVETP